MNNGKNKKGLVSAVATLAIISMLILSQTATSLVLLSQTDKNMYYIGETITFSNSIKIAQGERIPVDSVQLVISKEGVPFDTLSLPVEEVTNTTVQGENQVISMVVTVTHNNAVNEIGNLSATYSGQDYDWGTGYGYGYSNGDSFINYTAIWDLPTDSQLVGNYTATFVLNAGTGPSLDQFVKQVNFTIDMLDQLTVTIDTPSDGTYTNQTSIWINGSVNDPSLSSIQRVLSASGTVIFEDAVDNEGTWTKQLITFSNANYYDGAVLWHVESGDGKTYWRYSDPSTGKYHTFSFGMEVANAGVIWSEDVQIGEGSQLTFDTWWDTEIGPEYDHKMVVVKEGSTITIMGMIVDPPPDTKNFDEDIMASEFKNMMYSKYPEYNLAENWEVNFINVNTWDSASFDLSEFAGKTVQIGFMFNTYDEWANDFDGWKVDNIQLIGKGAKSENIPVTDQMFNRSVDLKEGLNSITLFADNGYLNWNTTLNIYKDTVAPQIGFTFASNYTNSSTFNITWFVTDTYLKMAKLYLNGEMVQKVTSSGFQSKQRSLNEGTNTITIVAEDYAGNTNTTSINVTLDTTPPTVTVMSVVYPTGVTSARPGDEAVIRVNASDSGVGLLNVILSPPGGGGGQDINSSEPEEFPMLESESFYRLMWDVGDATHFAPMIIPTDVAIVTGNYTFNITAYDKAMNSVTTSVNVSIASTLSAFNLEFMPGWNLISLPLIPDNSSVEAMFGNVDGIESVWSYDANSSSWYVYNPDPSAPDNLDTVETGKGYWVLTNSSSFTTIQVPNAPLPPVAVPIKVNYTGVYLQAGQVPPTYDVYQGWNLIGFHSEVNMTASEYLSGLTYPTRTWTSLIGYDNYVDFKNNKVADGIFDRLRPADYMKPGSGYWLYVKQSGEITP